VVVIRRGGLELLLENSTKLHKVEVHPKEGDSKVLLPRSLCISKATLCRCLMPQQFFSSAGDHEGASFLGQVQSYQGAAGDVRQGRFSVWFFF
jgi:hypothetical protein